MNLRAFLLTLCLALPGLAGPLDPPPDRPYPLGFAELNWGTPIEKVKAAFLTKSGVTLAPESNESHLVFNGGTFLDAPAETWTLTFANGRLTEGKVQFKPSAPKRAYDELRAEISKKYRQDGRHESEGAHFASYWHFDSKDGAYGIACDLKPDGIRLTYKQERAGPPSAKALKKQL